MALTCLKRALLAACMAALTSAAAQAQAPPATVPAGAPATVSRSVQLIDKDQPVHVDAARSELDWKSHQMVYHDVVISQGTMRVQADTAQATGLDFANSRWSFNGNVRIDAEPRGSLRSDSAVVEFKDNLISLATVVGKPAEFEQKREGSTQIARGHADKIVYDVSEGSVRLTDDAWLSDGQSEISGPLLVYNIRAQRVQAAADPGGSDRVHITIAPRATPGANKPDASKAGAAITEPAKPAADPQP